MSVIDYAICDQDLYTHIANLIVKEPLCLLACGAGVKRGGREMGRKTRDWGLERERDRLQ